MSHRIRRLTFEPLYKRIFYQFINFLKYQFNGSKKYPNRLIIIDPEKLHQKLKDKSYSRKYKKYKKTYIYGQSGGTNLIEVQKKLLKKGKKVRCWRLVLSHSDFSMDEYVPIFSRGRKKRRIYKKTTN